MNIEELEHLLNRIETYIENHNVVDTSVSKASVGWHLDHSLKVINKVSETLKKSDPQRFKNNFSLLGKIFFTLNFFPRGKAKSPKYVRPPEIILKEDILNQIKTAKRNIEGIIDLDENAYFKHPIFGHINKKRITKFLKLHTNHHLKIVRDILK